MIFWETNDGQHFGQQNLTDLSFLPVETNTTQSSLSPSTTVNPYTSNITNSNQTSSSLPIPTLQPQLVSNFTSQSKVQVASVSSGVGPQNSTELLTTLLDCPLRFLLISPSKVVHDFDIQSFCIVPFTFRVRNTSPFSKLSFSLETIKPSDVKETNDSFGQGRQYFWAGATSYGMMLLEPEEEMELCMSVCFCKPGVYNLTRFRFTIPLPSSPTPRILICPFQHLITVEKSSPTNPPAIFPPLLS